MFFLFRKLIFDLCFNIQPQTPIFIMSANSDDQILEHGEGNDKMDELSTQVQLLSVNNGIVAEIPNRGGRITDGTPFVERISFERTSERNFTSRNSLSDHMTISGQNPSATDVAYDRKVMVVSSALDPIIGLLRLRLACYRHSTSFMAGKCVLGMMQHGGFLLDCHVMINMSHLTLAMWTKGFFAMEVLFRFS